jgi:hypothetical protein
MSDVEPPSLVYWRRTKGTSGRLLVPFVRRLLTSDGVSHNLNIAVVVCHLTLPAEGVERRFSLNVNRTPN